MTDFARLAATRSGGAVTAVTARAPAKVNVHLGGRTAAARRLPRAADRLPRRLAVRHGHRAARGRALAHRHRGGCGRRGADSCRPTAATSSGGPPSSWPTTPACRPTPTIDIAKSIPAAAGLAGGSADAAAALVALDALWGTRAGRGATSPALAAQLGSDVPVQPARAGSPSARAAASSSRRCWRARRRHWVLGIAGEGLVHAGRLRRAGPAAGRRPGARRRRSSPRPSR